MKYFPLLILSLFFISLHQAVGQSSDISGMPQKSYHWFGNDTSKLKQQAKPVTLHPPVFGKKRRRNGMILPLPFGTGFRFLKIDQPYKASSFEISNYENNLVIKTEKVKDQTEAGEISIVFRPDIWIFPFLNVYGLAGYTSGYTHLNFTAQSFTVLHDDGNNIPVDSSFTLRSNPEYSGSVYGFGTTVSTGFKGYFILLNYEYSKTSRQDYKKKMTYQFFKAKTGILLGHNKKKGKGALWLGSGFMHDRHLVEGLLQTADVFPGKEWILGDFLHYQGTLSVAHSWNFLIGGFFNINDHHIIVLELGVLKRKHLDFSYTFRF